MRGAARCLLPVSGRLVELRPLTGAEDLLLAEAAGPDAALALALARRLAVAADGRALDCGELCVSDLDALILRLRQSLLGDRIVADVACRAEGCGRRIDISFAIDDYLAHHRPRRPRLRHWSVAAAPEPGWYALSPRGAEKAAAAAQFRLPSAEDELAVSGRADAASVLAQRCIRPADAPAPLRRAAETAMAALAPSLADDLQGVCPECGGHVTIPFDARRFALQELRGRARFVYEDIHLLAQRYHWSERAILALPNGRRASYAELARQIGSA